MPSQNVPLQDSLVEITVAPFLCKNYAHVFSYTFLNVARAPVCVRAQPYAADMKNMYFAYGVTMLGTAGDAIDSAAAMTTSVIFSMRLCSENCSTDIA